MIIWLLLLIGFFVVVSLFLYRKKISTTQVYKFTLGKYNITALLDGYIEYSFEDVIKDDIALDQPCLESKTPHSLISVPVNVYVVNTGSKVILVDVGSGGYDQTKTGFLMEALDSAGYSPDQVSDILITHLHLDHVAGLLKKDGQKAFPNAQLYISKEDVAYWIYEQQVYPELSPLIAKLIVSYALHTFNANQNLFEGVSVVSTPGHSHGHSSFLFESEGKKILIWGDIVHIPDLQFAYPGMSLKDDSNNLLAIDTRKKLFEKLVKEQTLIGGAHLPFPGLGYVQKSVDHVGYIFEPLVRPELLKKKSY